MVLTTLLCLAFGMKPAQAGFVVNGRPPQPGQGRKFIPYSEVIQAIPWDVQKSGPLIAPCPLKGSQEKTLEGIDRKLVPVGGITVVAPKTMVTLNTSFAEAPNLYDGLPRDAKVLYLLTLLSPDQWLKVTGDGLTLADCRGDQVPVMQSILPNPFRWTTVTALSENSWTGDGTGPAQQLSDADRQQVKLRLIKQINLTVYLENNQGYTATSVGGPLVKGKKLRQLKEEDSDEFGQKIKIQSPNTPQKSQLDLHDGRFDVKVALKKGERLEQLLGRAASASGIELFADPHYANMSMVEVGDDATARDILKGVALGVAGTYRKVGDMYVLTSDLEGFAAHQARLAVWEDDIEKLVQARKDLWRGVVAKAGQLDKIKFHPGPFDKLTPAELANMALNDKPDSNDQAMPTAGASDAIRNAVMNYKGGLKLDTDRVGVGSVVKFELVMPDGEVPLGTDWVDSTSRFSPNPYVWQPRKPRPLELPLTGSDLPRSILLPARSAQAARKDVEMASSLGLKEVWIETTNPLVLAAAVKEASPLGISVVSANRPWSTTLSAAGADVDRTVTGEHGAPFGTKKDQYLALTQFWQERSAYQPITREQLSPLSPELDNAWKWSSALASVPGVAGFTLLDAYPIGYAKDISYTSGSYFYSPATDLYLSYGYSLAQRLQFLRQQKVDPADLECRNTRTQVSLQEVWGDAWTSTDYYQTWQQTRAKWSHDAISKLLATLATAGKPILITGQPVKIHLPPYSQTYLYTWTPGQEPPTSPEDYDGGTAAKTSSVTVVRIHDDDDVDQRLRVAANLVDQITKLGKPVVMDFTEVPPNRLEEAVRSWLRK